ncbi:MAG: SDR family NAD(P)-dependent oxidoreductase [Planctomycetota bacterium]|nr:SDR family NAD(P)-dependent oxidoreductase [Planctomycetota bacterium]
MKRLDGKTALITGGGSGIGAACAAALAAEGCRVAICGRDARKLETAAAAFKGEPKILAHPCDVADRASVAALLAWAGKELGRIDILINGAGTNVPNRLIGEVKPEDWDMIMAINVTGAFNMLKGVLPRMRERRDGLVINIGSTAGLRAGALGGVAYNASKFALKALSISVMDELREEGVRVTTIHPGEVDTPILANRPKPVTPEHRAKMLHPEDVAAAVLMVACLPPRAEVTELTIKPIVQAFV